MLLLLSFLCIDSVFKIVPCSVLYLYPAALKYRIIKSRICAESFLLCPLLFSDIVNVIFSSPATVAAFVACFLDCTLLRGDSAVPRDRGYHWWEKFRSYETDSRSEEFYALPYNFNKFFPSR